MSFFADLQTHTSPVLPLAKGHLEVEVVSHALSGRSDDRKKKWLLLFCAGWFSEMMLIISLWPTNWQSFVISLTNWAIKHLKKSPDCLLTRSNGHKHTVNKRLDCSVITHSTHIAANPVITATCLLHVLSYCAGLITTINVLLRHKSFSLLCICEKTSRCRLTSLIALPHACIIKILLNAFFSFFLDGPRPSQKEIISLRAFMLLFLKQLILKVRQSEASLSSARRVKLGEITSANN